MIKDTKECFVNVNSLSKKFSRSLFYTIVYGLTEILFSTLKYKQKRSILKRGEFWALKNISLKLSKGDRLGIVGVNGSGKSTLLRLISGIYEPDEGDVYVNGKLVSFLAPGTGFHPHLSVKENVYINAALLGMGKKDVNENMEQILKFSELENVVNSPLGILSPGMTMRLSISIAIISKPDIFIIDEVLAIGDINFREKVIDYLKSISDDIIIVIASHNKEIIESLCNKKLVLETKQKSNLSDIDNG